MQYSKNFTAVKIKNSIRKKVDILIIFVQNIDCVYTLEPSNEYPQSMFWRKIMRNMDTPVYPRFSI